MPIEQLEEMSKKNVESILRNVHNLCCYAGNSTDEFCLEIECMRLDISCRWLQTDSLELQRNAMDEYVDFIESTKRKHETMINNDTPPQTRTYSHVPHAMQIWYIDYARVLQHLIDKDILQYSLAVDMNSEIIGQSYDIMTFLAANGCLVNKHIDLLCKNLYTDDEELKVCIIVYHVLFVFSIVVFAHDIVMFN